MGTTKTTDSVLVGAGDMRNSGVGLKQTADLIKTLPGIVMMLGDATMTSAVSEYLCYDAAWGHFKDRTRVLVIGNHEYQTRGAIGYFGYGGAAAHSPSAYCSLDLGAWHIIALDSNCGQGGGCASGSAQEQWRKANVAAHRYQC